MNIPRSNSQTVHTSEDTLPLVKIPLLVASADVDSDADRAAAGRDRDREATLALDVCQRHLNSGTHAQRWPTLARHTQRAIPKRDGSSASAVGAGGASGCSK